MLWALVHTGPQAVVYAASSQNDRVQAAVPCNSVDASADRLYCCLQCRAAFGGPIDPHLVLGGFTTDASFSSYSADATSFIVTYPLDSSPDKRSAAYAMLLALASHPA